ncbi:hypothetical protein ACWGM0_17770 [Sphingomonas bisphenolicum]
MARRLKPMDWSRVRQVRETPAHNLGNLDAFQRRFPVSGQPISAGWCEWDAITQCWRDFA